MEFSSIWYFSFWSLISMTFSTAGIYALHNANTSVSYMLDYCFILSVSCSMSYAFLDRPVLEHDQHELQLQVAPPSNQILLNFLADFATLYGPLLSLASAAYATLSRNSWNRGLVICTLVTAALLLRNGVKSVILGFKYSEIVKNFNTGFAGPLRMYPYYTLYWVLLQGFLLLSLEVLTTPLFWDLLMSLILMSISFPSVVLLYAARFRKLVSTSSVAAYVYQERRFFEIVCGVLANTLAQYYFRFQSLPLVLAFLSLAIAWLGNLANVQPSTDFGIFQFLVTAGLQSAVGLFGLHFYSFLVVLVGIALMVLRWKMESVSLRHFGGQEGVVRDWNRFEVLFGNEGNGDQPGEVSFIPAV